MSITPIIMSLRQKLEEIHRLLALPAWSLFAFMIAIFVKVKGEAETEKIFFLLGFILILAEIVIEIIIKSLRRME